jgi:hypothetical protein
MTADQLDAISDAFMDLFGLLRDADPGDKAELYSRLGLRLTYQPGPETVIAEVVTPATDRVFDWCPRGEPPRVTSVPQHGFPCHEHNRQRSHRLADREHANGCPHKIAEARMAM